MQHERLELPDGDFLELCWTGKNEGPLVLVIHGLEGSIHSPYAKLMMAGIEAQGWRGVFMHFRGCGEQYNRLKRNYHSGDTGDIAFVLETLQTRFPQTALAAIAFSLGGNALLKYLGETGGNNPLQTAVCVSVPFLLNVGAVRLEKGFSRLYQRYLIGKLQKKMKEKYAGNKFDVRTDGIEGLVTFRQIDNEYTAPIHGFRDVDDYYEKSSSRQYMKHITTPTLVIHSLDDPFLLPDAVPTVEELGSGVTLELSKGGGHVGFIDGKYPWRARHWLGKRVPEFLSHYLET